MGTHPIFKIFCFDINSVNTKTKYLKYIRSKLIDFFVALEYSNQCRIERMQANYCKFVLKPFCAILIFSSVNTGISLFIVKRLENGFFYPSQNHIAYFLWRRNCIFDLPSLRVKTLWFSSEPKPEICSISETIPVFIISTEYIYGIPVLSQTLLSVP